MPVRLRTTRLEVWITPPPTAADPTPVPVRDPTAFAATCSFGFDQRYAEAEVRRTGGGRVAISYWSEVEIKMSCFPGAGLPEDGPETRFRGHVVPIDNALYPIENVLHCKGRLYRAAFVKNTQPGGTDLVPPGSGGVADEAMVQVVLNACGVPVVATNLGGTGKSLGAHWIDREHVLTPGPFTWAEGQSGLDFIEALDEVSVPDPVPGHGTPGRYRTVESLGGVVFRAPYRTVPEATPAASFTEGVDVFDARIGRDPAGAANRVTVVGAPMPYKTNVGGTDTEVVMGSEARFTVASAFAPYLPPGLPLGPEGFPAVTLSFTSALIEKRTRDDPDVPEDVLSCQTVAEFLLAEHNTVLDTLEFSTPRDDLLAPGWTVHLNSPRLGLVDPTRHYWIQHLDVDYDERGAFTQRLRCLRRS
jgi:hypothetical protein